MPPKYIIDMATDHIEKGNGREWIDKSDHMLAMLANLKKTIKNREIAKKI